LLFGGASSDGSIAYGGGLFAYADGATTVGGVPTRLSFVTGSNSGDRAERLQIKADGNIIAQAPVTINNELAIKATTGGGVTLAGYTNPFVKVAVGSGTHYSRFGAFNVAPQSLYITQNVYFDGTNWVRDRGDLYGAGVFSIDTTGTTWMRFRYSGAGANPAILTTAWQYTSGNILQVHSKISPITDGTSALQLTNSLGTAIATLDTTNSRFGIGVTPLAKFHVESTAEQLRIGYNANNYLSVTVGNTGETTFNNAGSSRIYNFVGNAFPVLRAIRETTSSNQLGSVASQTLKYTSGNPSAGFGPGFIFQVQNSSGTSNNVGVVYGVLESWNSSPNLGVGGLQFAVFNNSPSPTAALSILSNTNVGIGTTAPAYKLDVNGDARINSTNKLFFGTSASSSISYDGTNLLINPKDVGSGIVNVLGGLNQTLGNATINMIYGEMYCKNDSGCGTIDLVSADVYVAMANQTSGNNNGFALNGATNLTAQYSGMYKAEAKVVVTGGVPAGEYGMKLYINETGQNNCYDHFHVGADQVSMVITCLVRINAGDNVSIRFDDHASPVTDLTIYASNLNLVRVGN
jgi:hypothetical protein